MRFATAIEIFHVANFHGTNFLKPSLVQFSIAYKIDHPRIKYSRRQVDCKTEMHTVASTKTLVNIVGFTFSTPTGRLSTLMYD